jgi:hypothetical protein
MLNSDLQKFTMIVQVDANPGEQDVSIAKVSGTDMEVLDPMLQDIKSKKGYYPTRNRVKPGNPSARDLYHEYIGWDVFESIVPRPVSGFTTILSVKVFSDSPFELDMLI